MSVNAVATIGLLAGEPGTEVGTKALGINPRKGQAVKGHYPGAQRGMEYDQPKVPGLRNESASLLIWHPSHTTRSAQVVIMICQPVCIQCPGLPPTHGGASPGIMDAL